MLKKWLPYLIFFVLLLTAYFVFVFTQTDINKSSLAVINDKVQPFSFVNQDGKTITDRDVEGKVMLAEYFFTTCKGICPKMNANMRRVFDEFKNDSNFIILSHTCMPETDSVPLLKAYEQKMLYGNLMKGDDGSYKIEYDSTKKTPIAIDNKNWMFLTGKKSELYDLARHSYMIDFSKMDSTAKIDDQFIHTQFFALLDKKTRVRGIYDGLKEDEIQKLLKDIRALQKESFQNRSLKGY
ncbi:MAG: SCO family protein [Ferruginibacter sp.]